jgi:cytoskeleton protein RodZ
MENSDNIAEIDNTPGKRLREARESAGMSPREMADRLNWMPSHVTAVEEDRYEELRGAAFVRGYLRAYARAVGLDEDEIVAVFSAMHPDQETAPARSAPPAGAASQKTGLSVVLGTLVAVAVIALIWWQQQKPDSPPVSASASEPASSPARTPSASQADAVGAAYDSQPVSASQDAARVAEPAPTAPSPAPIETAPAAPANAAASSREATAVSQVEAVPEPAAEAVDPAAADIAGPLQFSFSGDCWLEVRDGVGQLIYADLRSAGDSLELSGEPPFEILAGDASAVALRYRGQPVAIRTRPGRDSARFTVGEP